MKEYKEIYNTTNPILLQQIEYALDKAGIQYMTKGKKALEIGNIELTGIEGASVQVKANQFKKAKEALNFLEFSEISSGNFNSKLVYLFGVALLIALLFMIYSAYLK